MCFNDDAATSRRGKSLTKNDFHLVTLLALDQITKMLQLCLVSKDKNVKHINQPYPARDNEIPKMKLTFR